MPNNTGVMVLVAHPDDHIIGAGGTIAKYSSEGKKVIVVIASMGEKSNPWLKEEVVRRIRTRETLVAQRIVGEYKNLNLKLKEGTFPEGLRKQKVTKMLRRLIKNYRIKRILTHSIDDPHPDHKAVVKFVLEFAKRMPTVEVYSFNVWNPFILRKTTAPRMYVDISKTFFKKAQALRAFKSQRHVVPLWFGIIPYWFGAMLVGLKNRTRYAEVFLKIK